MDSNNCSGCGHLFSRYECQLEKDCENDAIAQRALPLGILFGAGTYCGMKKGFPSGDSAPLVLVASLVGYYLGLFSYRKELKTEKVPPGNQALLFHEINHLKDKKPVIIIAPPRIKTRVIPYG